MLMQDQVAIVTGASRGIGFAMAKAFLDQGARVMLSDIDEASLAEASRQLSAGDRVAYTACDVAVLAQVEAVVVNTVNQFGRVDVLVNNAGITRDASLRKMTEDQFDQVIAVHLRGTWNGIKAVSEVMREQKAGSIINISSISGRIGLFGQTNYSAAKAGIVGLTKAASKELAGAGVRVNAIMPGLIETAMTAAMPPDVRQRLTADVPLGRMGQPSEVASTAVFLASGLSSFITGSVIEVSGGQ